MSRFSRSRFRTRISAAGRTTVLKGGRIAYFIDLFSPETYQAFADSSRSISGFRLRHKTTAERVSRGDLLVCYLAQLSRWFSPLEVLEGPFIDHKPIFVPENDPFVVRLRVRAKVWLEYDKGIPVQV